MWTKHQTLPELTELIEAVYRLQTIGGLEPLLAVIPNRMMDPSSRNNLLNIVSKVARYRETAHFLYRTAQKYPLVRQMECVSADLPGNIFDQVAININTPNLASKIMGIGAVYGRPEISYIYRLLKTTETQANKDFATQTRKNNDGSEDTCRDSTSLLLRTQRLGSATSGDLFK
jgi:hypothetical protein